MGLIKALTATLIDMVLADLRRWSAAGIDAPVAVNLSMRNLLDPQFPEVVTTNLESTGVRPGLVRFEITETAVMSEPLRVMENMTRLRQLGVGFAIDDFGTGYSSLAYLQRLPVDEIKIDRSFVGRMASEPGSASIVRATVDLGHSLGLEVVAEGVEDRETWDLLASYLCQTAQGYLISRPIPSAEVEPWLRKRTWEPGARSTSREAAA
jgi:EAL domain-containing protein (putative c-di-GMP-specific phosphodiesterase class I)